MTRQEAGRLSAVRREKKAKQLVINTITGLYKDDYIWPKTKKWNITKIAEFTGLHRQTVSKHIKEWEAEQRGGNYE